jgi:hypothetical protein
LGPRITITVRLPRFAQIRHPRPRAPRPRSNAHAPINGWKTNPDSLTTLSKARISAIVSRLGSISTLTNPDAALRSRSRRLGLGLLRPGPHCQGAAQPHAGASRLRGMPAASPDAGRARQRVARPLS